MRIATLIFFFVFQVNLAASYKKVITLSDAESITKRSDKFLKFREDGLVSDKNLSELVIQYERLKWIERKTFLLPKAFETYGNVVMYRLELGKKLKSELEKRLELKVYLKNPIVFIMNDEGFIVRYTIYLNSKLTISAYIRQNFN